MSISLLSFLFWYQKIFVNNLLRPNTISPNRLKVRIHAKKKDVEKINRMLAFASPIIIITIEVVTIIATLGVIHLSACPQDNVSIQ